MGVLSEKNKEARPVLLSPPAPHFGHTQAHKVFHKGHPAGAHVAVAPKRSSKKKRSVRFGKVETNDEGKLTSKLLEEDSDDSTEPHLRHQLWQSYRKPVAAVAVYYLIGYLFYHYKRGWSALDCAYFSTVLMTTIGYGDQVPHSDISLMFTASYAMLAFILVATAVSRLLNWTVLTRMMEREAKQRSRVTDFLEDFSQNKNTDVQASSMLSMAGEMAGGKSFMSLFRSNSKVSLLDQDGQKRRRRNKVFVSVGLYVLWLAVGTVVNAWLNDLPDSDWHGSPLVKGFYFSVVTLTTIGFGDFTPHTPFGKVFDIIYIITGVPICVSALTQMVELIWGPEEEEHNVDLIQGLSGQKLKTMLEFQNEMARAGCGNKVDSKVSRYEFLMFVLTRNGIVELEMVQQIMDNFQHLDVTHTGCLEHGDVQSDESANEHGMP